MIAPTDYPPFPSFRPKGLDFLRALAKNNEREWFNAHKQTYVDELRWPLECLVADVSRRLSAAGLPLRGDPKHSRFRIYRDLRFTSDPRPYKTHVSAVFDRSGTKDAPGVVYVHVEPAGSFLAAGFHRMKASFLRPVRQAVVDDPGRFRRMLGAMEARGLPVDCRGDALKGMPQGFSEHREGPLAEYLRWTSYLVHRPVPDVALQEPSFAEEVVELTRQSLPLLRYVWQARAV